MAERVLCIITRQECPETCPAHEATKKTLEEARKVYRDKFGVEPNGLLTPEKFALWGREIFSAKTLEILKEKCEIERRQSSAQEKITQVQPH